MVTSEGPLAVLFPFSHAFLSIQPTKMNPCKLALVGS